MIFRYRLVFGLALCLQSNALLKNFKRGPSRMYCDVGCSTSQQSISCLLQQLLILRSSAYCSHTICVLQRRHEDTLAYLKLDVVDLPSSDILSLCRDNDTNTFIENARKAGGVLVHCQAGNGLLHLQRPFRVKCTRSYKCVYVGCWRVKRHRAIQDRCHGWNRIILLYLVRLTD